LRVKSVAAESLAKATGVIPLPANNGAVNAAAHNAAAPAAHLASIFASFDDTKVGKFDR
jgi:hypothetical protein